MSLLGQLNERLLCRNQTKFGFKKSVNRAFERYFGVELDDLREVYADTKMTPKSVSDAKGQLIDITDK